MERHEIIELMGQLKLAGMRAAGACPRAGEARPGGRGDYRGAARPAFGSAHHRGIAARPARRQSRPLDGLPLGCCPPSEAAEKT